MAWAFVARLTTEGRDIYSLVMYAPRVRAEVLPCENKRPSGNPHVVFGGMHRQTDGRRWRMSADCRSIVRCTEEKC